MKRGTLALPLVAALLAGLPAARANATSASMQSLKEIRERAVVMQRWETSCAAASLATVLTYAFADPVSERHVVASMLGRTEPARVQARGGFSLLDMKRFVEQRGYGGAAYNHLSLADLKLFRAPIVAIRVHGINHYVVVNAITDRDVRVADPAFGNRAMPLNRFQKLWLDGLAFVVTRGSGDSR